MAESDEIKIGEKSIGMNTSITFSVKTLFYFFGILFTFLSTLFGWFYFKTIEREEQMKKNLESSLNGFKKEVMDEIHPLRYQIFDLGKGQGEIKTDIRSVINKQLELPTTNIQDTHGSNSPIGPR